MLLHFFPYKFNNKIILNYQKIKFPKTKSTSVKVNKCKNPKLPGTNNSNHHAKGESNSGSLF